MFTIQLVHPSSPNSGLFYFVWIMLASSYSTSIDSNEQNYSAGDPTPVLYIKNLAKDVVVDDLYFIFGEFSLSP